MAIEWVRQAAHFFQCVQRCTGKRVENGLFITMSKLYTSGIIHTHCGSSFPPLPLQEECSPRTLMRFFLHVTVYNMHIVLEACQPACKCV